MENTNNKYPDYIMRYLRQRRDLEPGDTKLDKFINEYPPDLAFREVVNWNGFLGGWEDRIKS